MSTEEVKLPKVRLFFDRILTTFKNENTTKAGIIQLQPDSKQIVVACGPNANVSIGDVVEINYNLMPKKYDTPAHGIGKDKETIVLPTEMIDGEEYLFISSREIKWVYNKD